MEMIVWRQAEVEKIFGQQTPRRWGWGTPLKKRTATRTGSVYFTRTLFVNRLLPRASRNSLQCEPNKQPFDRVRIAAGLRAQSLHLQTATQFVRQQPAGFSLLKSVCRLSLPVPGQHPRMWSGVAKAPTHPLRWLCSGTGLNIGFHARV